MRTLNLLALLLHLLFQELKMELLSPIRRGLVEMRGTAFVGNKVCAEADMVAQIVKREGK